MDGGMGTGWDWMGRDGMGRASRQAGSITAAAVYISIRRADHVRTHVPENADASHRPGWALRWRAAPACGLDEMRQTLRERETQRRD